MDYDAIVAGAGIWGCTVARTLADGGKRVLVLEKRAAVGGNVRCETDPETGIEVHVYGSHIFHTGIDEVWNFMRRFTEFNGYQHKVLARYGGKTYFLPLGLALVNQFYGVDLKPEELPAFIAKEAGGAVGPSNGEDAIATSTRGRSGGSSLSASARGCSDGVSPSPKNFEEQAISFIGRPLYEAFIREYTRKQWGTDPKNLSADIIRRLPVRASYDVNYFPDWRQGIPLDGYNAVFDRMLDHPGIEVRCNAEFKLGDAEFAPSAERPVYYSGPIDALFGYRFGHLPWRSLRFETERAAVKDFQGTSVVNYTGAEVEFTRIHEFKHYHPENKGAMEAPSTIICREYPKTWEPGDEPYYPVDTPESRELLAKYRAEAAKVPGLVIGGRLGEYKYYDMDKSVARALETAKAAR